MTEQKKSPIITKPNAPGSNTSAGVSRRDALKTLGAGAGVLAGVGALPGMMGHVNASDEPIKVGFQVHRTGIGAAYGRWYDRTTCLLYTSPSPRDS